MAAWVGRGGMLEQAIPRPRPGKMTGRFDVRAMASTAVVAARMASGNGKLIDARAEERFRGEIEPIDRVPGHIPGAVNRPFARNLGSDGKFKSPGTLGEEFRALLGDSPSNEALLMCGSGASRNGTFVLRRRISPAQGTRRAGVCPAGLTIAITAQPSPLRRMIAPTDAAAQPPWENAVNVLQTSFTGPIARGLSLVAIVIGGLTFAYGEGGSKRILAGIVFGVGMAIGAVNFMAWLFP